MVQITATTAVEDFGLSYARFLASTLTSGAIALLAVVFSSMLGLKLNDVQVVAATDWKHIFDWSTNLHAVFVAAVFGFAPSLFFQWLRSQTDQYQKNLSSSQATGKSASAG